MKWKLPRYTGRDYQVLLIVIAPFTISINSLLLGTRYFTDGTIFLLASFIAAVDFSIGFFICISIGAYLRRIFKDEKGIGRRLLLMIFLFLILTILFLLIIFRGYEHISVLRYRFDDLAFAWACIGTGIYVVFITFLLEGIARYEIWKNRMDENEQLSRLNRQRRLQGLKSQVNPHFLFNSLNSLSSLIDTDEDEAEAFLDELSKVYRYMLRTEEEDLVALSSELDFTRSYCYLLKARYGEGLRIEIRVDPEDLRKYLAPLTLQTIIENAFTQNAMTREKPLLIRIGRNENGLIIRNGVQPKIISEAYEVESGIDNLVIRYALLHHAKIIIQDTPAERKIEVPLFNLQNQGAI